MSRNQELRPARFMSRTPAQTTTASAPSSNHGPGTPSANRATREAVLLPLLLGVGLALLYGLGALMATAQLQRQGVSTTDLVALIPLEQMLAKGILAAVTGAAIFGVLTLLGLMLTLHERMADYPARDVADSEHLDRWTQRLDDDFERGLRARDRTIDDGDVAAMEDVNYRLEAILEEKQRTVRFARRKVWTARAYLWGWRVLLPSLIVVTAVTLPVLPAFGVVVAVAIAYASFAIDRPRLGFVGYFVVLGAFVGNAFAFPPPLSAVTDQSGRQVGLLISARDSQWYVVTPQSDVRVIPEDSLDDFRLTSVEGYQRTVAQEVIRLLP